MVILETRDLKKQYGTGETAVHALAGGKPVGGKRRICRGGRNLRIRKIDAFTYAWRTRPGNIRQSLCGRQGHLCIKG